MQVAGQVGVRVIRLDVVGGKMGKGVAELGRAASPGSYAGGWGEGGSGV